MALAPTGRRYAHDAPPSPIPTARGSRSAANHSFIQFLETSIRLPRLSLPPSHFLSSTTQPLHSDVDFRSLMIGDDYCDSVSRILSSSEKFGAFRIINHGVSLDRLTSLLNETENVFNDKVLGPNFVKSYEDREEILWFRSRTQRMRLTDESYRNFRQNMDYVGNKLEAIADRINGVILESLDEKIQAEIKERESTLIICRYYSHYRCRRVNGRIGKEKEEDDALSLHLPLQRCEFHAQSDGNSLHFNADADVVIVAIGNQLPCPLYVLGGGSSIKTTSDSSEQSNLLHGREQSATKEDESSLNDNRVTLSLVGSTQLMRQRKLLAKCVLMRQIKEPATTINFINFYFFLWQFNEIAKINK